MTQYEYVKFEKCMIFDTRQIIKKVKVSTNDENVRNIVHDSGDDFVRILSDNNKDFARKIPLHRVFELGY